MQGTAELYQIRCLLRGYSSRIGCEIVTGGGGMPEGRYFTWCLWADMILARCGFRCRPGSSIPEIRDYSKQEPARGIKTLERVEACKLQTTCLTADVKWNYPLNRPLQVGDVLKAWGYYKDEATEKFSFNILGSDLHQYLIHVDFRPAYIPQIVINSKGGAGEHWDTEVYPRFGDVGFVNEEEFEVAITVLENEYKISYNGVELSQRFPQRYNIADAQNVKVNGGTLGTRWISILLPDYR